MLTSKQRVRLSALGQGLSCLASVGRSGLTEAFCSRLSELLARHELVKLRLSGEDAGERRAQAEDLAARTGSELVRIIGKVALFYLAHPDPGSRKIDPGE